MKKGVKDVAVGEMGTDCDVQIGEPWYNSLNFSGSLGYSKASIQRTGQMKQYTVMLGRFNHN
jgi:hypothetical protein